MKAIFKLSINSNPVKLIEHNLSVELEAVGRGLLLVDMKEQPNANQIITFDYGFDNKPKLARFFIGIIESVTPQGSGVYLLRCVELSYVLHAQMPMAFNFVDGQTILSSLSNKSGLKIFHSNAEYWKKEISSFCSLGSGFNALMSLGDALEVSNLTWQQQTDGSLFVGLPHELPYSSSVMNIDYKVFDSIKSEDAYAVSMVPGLFPGLILNGQQVRQIDLSGSKMVVKCISK